jgi:tetratricopeptide (TPR) repeat protein
MTAKTFLSLFASIMPLVSQAQNAPEEKALVAQRTLLPHQQAFLNLPEENRKTFVKHITEAERLFNQKRIFESIEELEKAAKIYVDSPEIYSLRGSCFVEMRSFDKALEQYEKARAFSAENTGIDFNIAEMYFVTKEWKKCSDLLEKVLASMPPQQVALARLVEFKILLSKKKLGLKDEVSALVAKYDFLDDSPFYYYAQAAVCYDAGDLTKAEEWLAIAARIFTDPNVIAPWQDTLVEYGYIKSYYGDDHSPAQ